VGTRWCGATYGDMADKCATECPNGRDDECPDGEICWGDSPCALIEGGEGLEDGANGTSSAGTSKQKRLFLALGNSPCQFLFMKVLTLYLLPFPFRRQTMVRFLLQRPRRELPRTMPLRNRRGMRPKQILLRHDRRTPIVQYHRRGNSSGHTPRKLVVWIQLE